MRTLRTLALIPVAGLLLAACGSSGSTDTTANTGAATTLPATTLPATSAPVDTGAPSSVADTTPATAIDGPVQIDVKVGTDSGPDRVEKVKLGSDVTLNLTNPDAAEEYHVHGVDLEQKVDKGVTATFNFVADKAGTYEVESHTTETVLVVIEVG